MDTNDLFEVLMQKVGCMYISDMARPPFRERAIIEAKQLSLSQYDRRQLLDLCHFLSISQAELGIEAPHA